MADHFRSLMVPALILAIVASLWTYAQARTQSETAARGYWPALPAASDATRAPANLEVSLKN